MKEAARRNLHPHRSARMAMYLYGSRYAAQNGGSMDFWDKLTESEKQTCRECVEKLLQDRTEGGK
jgi:hypothetical protein